MIIKGRRVEYEQKDYTHLSITEIHSALLARAEREAEEEKQQREKEREKDAGGKSDAVSAL